MNEYVDALERVEAVQKSSELFDVLGGGEPGVEYRRLAKLLHPDRHPDDVDRAQKAFARLSELWSQYGTEAPLSETFKMETRRRAYVVRRAPAWQGDLASLYLCEHYEDANVIPGIMKIPRSPKNNDLMKNEAMVLKHISLEGDEHYKAYVPQHVETFRHRDPLDRKERLVNVLAMPEGLYSLQEVYDLYPNGVAPKDVAWMWRRLLVALAYVHSTGKVHGALTPDHILIHPSRGLVLVDWCYSVDVGSPLQVVVPKHRELYPAGALAQEDVDQKLDLRMGVQSLLYIMRGRVPRQYKGFAQYCAQGVDLDGFGLLEEFDELLQKMFGPRTYAPFAIPTTTRS